MKTLLIISVLFIISCRPILVTVECPHKEYAWGGMGEFEIPQNIEWPPKEYIYTPRQEPEYLYFGGQKIYIDSMTVLDAQPPFDSQTIRFIDIDP